MMITLWIQAISSLAMITVILLVQVLIYPQFKQVGPNEIGNYVKFHIRKISWVVIPVMLTELFSLIILWSYREIWSFWLLSSTVILALILGLTFIKIAPLHNQIAVSSDVRLISKLLSLNFARTVLWILKSISIFCLFIVFITPHLQFEFITNANINTLFEKTNGYQLVYEKSVFQANLDTIVSSLGGQQIESKGNLRKYIVRTPHLKFPDLIIIEHKKDKTVFWSKSLLGHFDFGKNKERLKWIQKKLEQEK